VQPRAPKACPNELNIGTGSAPNALISEVIVWICFFVNDFFVVVLWKLIGFAGYLYYNVSSFNCIV
jgi:hypothetical protein